MADLPRLFASPNIPFSGPLAQTTPRDFGAGVFHTIAQLADTALARQKPIDAAKASSEYDILMDDAINALPANADLNTWRDEIIQKDKEIRQTLGARYNDKDTQDVFNLHADRRFGENVRRVSGLQVQAAHGKQVADIETLRSMLSRRVAETDDPMEQDAARRIFQATINTASTPTMVAGRPVPPTLSPKQAEQEMTKFNVQALEEYATLVTRGNPQGIFTDDRIKNRLAPLGNARILEIESKARTEIQKEESRTDSITNKNKKLVYDAAYSAANFNRLDPVWLNDALAGNNPLVRPSEARTLKEVNEGSGDSGRLAAADAIWDEYTAGGRNMASLNRTRAKLNQLSKELGAPNKWILKYKDELQSDQTTLENQGISREANAIAAENRQISHLKTDYDAWVQSNPILNSIMGNMAVHEKAQIESIYRKEGKQAAEKKLETFKRGITEKAQSTPDKMKKVKDF